MARGKRPRLFRAMKITDEDRRRRAEFEKRVDAAPRHQCPYCTAIVIDFDEYPWNCPHVCDQQILHNVIDRLRGIA